jgi:hypothetical protein
MARELVLYCDESDSSGKHFGNFYGGALVESRHLAEVIEQLEDCKIRLNLLGEVRWQKITEPYAEKYIELATIIFKLVRAGKLKIRVMFTQNYFSAHRLTTEQRENGFFLLYYQFLKHAFGLKYAGLPTAESAGVRIYFDKLPDTDEKCAAFKGYVSGLSKNTDFKRAGIIIRQDQLAEIDSKEHVILQALDLVLGAMQFRLNDKHKEKIEGTNRRGKRTKAKERVYKHILSEIKAIYNGKAFNIGTNTGRELGMQSLWIDPYRHWLFKSAAGSIRPEFAKKPKHK